MLRAVKTVVSIPNDIFSERLAKRSKKSRSRLFSEALEEYLARYAPEEITDALNKAVSELDRGSDPFVGRLLGGF